MKTCNKCDTELIISKGNFQHTIFGKSIEVIEAPFFECPNCKNITYEDSRKIESLVKQAYRDNETRISYVQ